VNIAKAVNRTEGRGGQNREMKKCANEEVCFSEQILKKLPITNGNTGNGQGGAANPETRNWQRSTRNCQTRKYGKLNQAQLMTWTNLLWASVQITDPDCWATICASGV